MTITERATQRRTTRQPPVRRTSDLLRDILARNPDTQEFTIGGILESIGADNPEASLVLLSVPSIVPVPNAPGFNGLTAGAVGAHFVSGNKELRLPKAILQKKVPRRSLSVAIHAILPILEFAEKAVKPRLAWASHPLCRRIIGLLVFVLAATIAFPVIGFDPLHALSIFMISLGFAEQDGLAVMFGATVGVLSLALIAATAFKLHTKVATWLRRLVRKLGFGGLASYCEKHGWKRLASILRFEWQNLLLIWNPERAEAEKKAHAEPKITPAITERRTMKSSRMPRVRDSASSAERTSATYGSKRAIKK